MTNAHFHQDIAFDFENRVKKLSKIEGSYFLTIFDCCREDA